MKAKKRAAKGSKKKKKKYVSEWEYRGVIVPVENLKPAERKELIAWFIKFEKLEDVLRASGSFVSEFWEESMNRLVKCPEALISLEKRYLDKTLKAGDEEQLPLLMSSYALYEARKKLGESYRKSGGEFLKENKSSVLKNKHLLKKKFTSETALQLKQNMEAPYLLLCEVEKIYKGFLKLDEELEKLRRDTSKLLPN